MRNYILYFIQVDKKITTKQSKNMNTINSTTELAGNITICVVNKTLLKIAHTVLIYINIFVRILKKNRLKSNDGDTAKLNREQQYIQYSPYIKINVC